MASKLVDLAGGRKGDEGNFSIAEDGELKGLLQESVSAFREGHLPAGWILYSLKLHFPPPHLSLGLLVTSSIIYIASLGNHGRIN